MCRVHTVLATSTGGLWFYHSRLALHTARIEHAGALASQQTVPAQLHDSLALPLQRALSLLHSSPRLRPCTPARTFGCWCAGMIVRAGPTASGAMRVGIPSCTNSAALQSCPRIAMPSRSRCRVCAAPELQGRACLAGWWGLLRNESKERTQSMSPHRGSALRIRLPHQRTSWGCRHKMLKTVDCRRRSLHRLARARLCRC